MWEHHGQTNHEESSTESGPKQLEEALRGDMSHLYSSELIWDAHVDLQAMFPHRSWLDGENAEKIRKLIDSWRKCLKEWNLLSFSRKSGDELIIMCMSTQQEKTEILLAFK